MDSMLDPTLGPSFWLPKGSSNAAPSWQFRLEHIVETMREMSRQTDPQMMVQAYGKRMRQLMQTDGSVSLSRRDLDRPWYRITRSTLWKDGEINPWKMKDRLPLLDRGLLGDLLYAEAPVILNDLQVDPDDPGHPYLAGYGSAVAIPHFDQGRGLNMVLLLRKEKNSFHAEALPEMVWMGNLFGRAAQTLRLSEELREAYDGVDHELKVVADIQRSLLPTTLPAIAGLDLAAYYQTSKRAGGDYYDFFELPGSAGQPAGSPHGRWGILVADVSGHGTPAAVIMAVTHSLAHGLANPAWPPSRLLAHVNRSLTARYTNGNGTFVTAFYGVYDPTSREIFYSGAGHCPPRLRQADGSIRSLDGGRSLPLGIDADEAYTDALEKLTLGDTLVLYTDGITEAREGRNELFRMERLDAVLKGATGGARSTLDAVLTAVDRYTNSTPPNDDRTLLVAKVV